MSDFRPSKFADLRSASAHKRDTSRPIMLVGFQEQENLGLGYLAATLKRYGYRVLLFDFQSEPETILAAARSAEPLLIGFSLIFQFYVRRFAALIRYLREHGVRCHFTIGGHFPSLSHRETLELIPELDSVVRFEGELTLLELTDRISLGSDWHTVTGIAYQRGGETVENPMRPLLTDLDELPYPDRIHRPRAILGRWSTPILASRGCIRTCSFCSIHMFYRSAPGKVVRTRKPAHVAEEMRMLLEERGISLFLFQDDDFPVFGPVWRRWASEFVGELHRNRLPGRAIWKINCRADAVEPEIFAKMRDAGLYLVYMGLESGNEEGLRTLHKQITVQQNIRAVEVLKLLRLQFEFGFMLFEPSTTFASIRENLAFLRTIVGDGATAATFCRMVPYDGTPIKDELVRTGRLRGDVCNPDYDFLDPAVTRFYHALARVMDVSGWVHAIGGLSMQLNFAWSEFAVMGRLFPYLPGLGAYKSRLRKITVASNDLLFRIVEDMSRVFTDGARNDWSLEAVTRGCEGFQEEFLAERNTFVFSNQAAFLEVLVQSGAAFESSQA
jgi:anaerobic magnesium-protoporphyrin IX monomethyl ester cyclase